MFDGLLKSKFFSKCKSDIKLTRTRIAIITKKRNATQKYLRNDVADLLRNGLDTNAFNRVGGLLADMNKSQCYKLIDEYCEHLSNNLPAMNKQSECPEECREAAASLAFAAARFADLPELRELRTLFAERYVKSLDYYVNKQFTEMLTAHPPSNDMKLQLLQEIAAEAGLNAYDKSVDKVRTAAKPKEDDEDESVVDNVLTGNKPMGKSARTRLTKPPPVQEVAVGDENEKVVNIENVAQGRRTLRFFNGGGGHRDEEEKTMDRLLRHYSMKKGSNKTDKSEKEAKLRSQDGPTRASSLPVEPMGPTDTEHPRAASCHLDLMNANVHVHPKLPDYDEFVARLAAFREK
ncbi:hypothetical protein SASPL_118858 [Salvia splendens]|uniref:Vacuolar protein sorting-associated protein Ist1 n=1 Tax=Salvia splendens TaxID=180675 RepID=A0A8X8ZYT1_SALSN|nr:uncharacterized protein LOC121807573 [Salvia splendens]KAG6422292.1 hypothetical protein SASPL_118858 [Salvia splendens]